MDLIFLVSNYTSGRRCDLRVFVQEHIRMRERCCGSFCNVKTV